MSDQEVLSQEEVDALREGVAQGDIGTAASPEVDYKPIDFNHQERVVRSQFPVLGRISERFASKFPSTIYNTMSREITMSYDDIKILKYKDFMSGLSIPSWITIMRMNPLRGKALLILEKPLVYTLVENYFGGDGRFQSEIEDREFTVTEQKVINTIIGQIFRDIEHAWQPIIEVKLESLTWDMNPQLVNINDANDVMLVASYDLQFEAAGGLLHVVIPYMMLEPVRAQLDLSAARTEDDIDPNWLKSLENEIMHAELTLHATLVDTELNLRDIMQLQPGDVIPIEMPEQVTVEIEEIPAFIAKFGVSRDKCALKILHRIQH